MIDRIDLHALIDAKLISNGRQMLEAVAHPLARLANLAGAKGAPDVVPLAAGHVRRELVLPHELLHVQLSQLRLRIERVDVAWPAFHEQTDASLGLRRMMRRL